MNKVKEAKDLTFILIVAEITAKWKLTTQLSSTIAKYWILKPDYICLTISSHSSTLITSH